MKNDRNKSGIPKKVVLNSAFRIPHSSSGMTLIELLVSFAIFIALIATLVSLSTTSLDTWQATEGKKDIYDRAQVILDQLTDDLRCVFSENIWHAGDVHPAQFLCDGDENQRQRLRFVRSRPLSVMPATGPRKTVLEDYADLAEVAYLFDRDPKGTVLYRGIRPFDRRRKRSLFDEDTVRNQTSDLFRQLFPPIDTGVLHLKFLFWTPDTNAWDSRISPQRGRGRRGETIGPSTVWDSTRVDLPSFFLKKRKELDNPDFAYPERVQIMLILESQASDVRGVKLIDGIHEKDSLLRLGSTGELPAAPDAVRINEEWIEYSEKTLTELRVSQRGAKGTKAASHARDSVVRFGETFVMTVSLPAYREAVQ